MSLLKFNTIDADGVNEGASYSPSLDPIVGNLAECIARAFMHVAVDADGVEQVVGLWTLSKAGLVLDPTQTLRDAHVINGDTLTLVAR